MEPPQTPDGVEALTPIRLQDFIGQGALRKRIEVAIEAARRRKSVLGHVLLVGPPDFGKSTLAGIISRELGTKTVTLNANTCGRSSGDFAGFLTALEHGEVFILEDLQVLDKRVADFLSEPLKDFKMSFVIDSGPNARAVRLNLPFITFIATTTQKDGIPSGFLSSFKIVEHLGPYSQSELAAMAVQFGTTLRVRVAEGVADQIAYANCISPRDVMNRVLELRDYLELQPELSTVTSELARKALNAFAADQPTDGPSRREGRRDGIIETGPLNRRYQVFVSSTYEDLREERRQAMQALLETKCIPTGMELFPAASQEQWKLIQRVIDDCDYYVVIIGGRYGSLGFEGKSYTEMEFDYAVSIGKSVLGFYHADLDTLPGPKLEKDSIRRRQLEEFVGKVKKRICKPWTSAEGLASAIKSAILHAIEHDPKTGWVRAIDRHLGAVGKHGKKHLKAN